MLFYKVPVWEFLVPTKALLVGAAGYFRFPIFQYFPVYLMGLIWGTKLLEIKNLRHQKEIAEAIAFVSFSGIALALLGFLLTGNSLDMLLRRWPPSIPFLLAGTFFAGIAALFFYTTHQLKKTPLIRDSLLLLGQNALGLALSHVFLLEIYSLSGGLKTGSVSIFIFSFVLLLVFSLTLAAIIPFNFRFVLNLERGTHSEQTLEQEVLVHFEEDLASDLEKDTEKIERYFFIGPRKNKGPKKLIKQRHLLGASFVLALATFIVFPPVLEEYQIQKNKNLKANWEENDFGWRQNIVVKNEESLAEIPKDEVILAQIDHAALVAAKKSLPNGQDLLVKYFNGKKYEDVSYWLVSEPNKPNSTIAIELKERIKPKDTITKYYLYYGNNLSENNFTKTAALPPTKNKYNVSLQSLEEHPLLLTVDRRWSLKGNNPQIAKNLRIALKAKENFDSESATYLIKGTNLKGRLEKTANNLWEGVIKTEDLKPGKYQITAKIKHENETYVSSNVGFYVSYPLYVAWTQDWEGYDVPENYLAAISQIASEHKVVLTHFWNPRLTATDSVAEYRKSELLEWIKNRRDNFAESIQLHLHMFTDFVSQSGVTPKPTPNWGDSGDGYGSLTTNYNTDELVKIIQKGISEMQNTGLGTPKIYRAGGWFANLETLSAIEKAGLLADSSGRTAYKFYSQKGPWDLPQTAQPYYPSRLNQNKTGEPSFSLLEIPNNGADSYWFSTDEMKTRFNVNFSGGILSEPRQITYLSHPHWFNKKEQAKIEGVFNLIDQFKFANDYGPALYVTMDEIYEVFK